MADEREGLGNTGTGGIDEAKARSRPSDRQDAGVRSSFGGNETIANVNAGIDESASGRTRTGFGAAPDEGEDAPHDEPTQTGGRVEHALNSGRGRIADRLQRVGDRIEERARHLEEGGGGVQRKAGRAVLRAGEALDSSADYIRNHEVEEMRADLEDRIRDRPLLSIGIALGAGFLLARLMRD